MKEAAVFPGQGSQFIGMGLALFNTDDNAKKIFEQANEILNFEISQLMFTGSEEALKQTEITQPAIFLHSIVAYKTLVKTPPAMVAGHSLGEFTALVANECLSFEDGLKLVSLRAKAMQHACGKAYGTMAAIIGLNDDIVEAICNEISQTTDEIVVPANYNCPGQLVISGTINGIAIACERFKAAGAKRALLLPVGGAFHSPLMIPAQEELAKAIYAVEFSLPKFPIYQNIVAQAVTNPMEIKENLIKQLTGPVRWTQTVEQMIANGATSFTEVGPGKTLLGLVGKINRTVALNNLG